jgi:exodeoxyribonuclease VII small subunit
MATAPKAVSELTYEQARAELITVVQALEAGSQELEQAVALWQRGQELAARCQEWLDGVRAQIDASRSQAQSEAD